MIDIRMTAATSRAGVPSGYRKRGRGSPLRGLQQIVGS